MDRRALVWSVVYGCFLGIFAFLMRGFTVDDALISVQYAHNIATGHGYRFAALGPSTDGVTPLPWAFVLAPLASRDALTTLFRARGLGFVAWIIAAALLGYKIGLAKTHALVKISALVLCLASVPIAAYAVSGMETGVVMALATTSVAFHDRPFVSTLLASFVCVFRPELTPWALAWTGGRTLTYATSRKSRAIQIALILAAPVICATIRVLAFGHPYPLALLAKPSDLDHGLAYVKTGLLATVLPIACFAPFALTRAPGEKDTNLSIARAVFAAFVVHAIVIVLVGGDWMAYARLFAPVVPSLALVFVYSANHSTRWSLLLRFLLAIPFGAYLWLVSVPRGKHVASDREALVHNAEPLLASCHAIATVDIGWVSAASDARIFDMAGLTDPAIAALPGGHTSKAIDATMLLDRNVDCVLSYVETNFERDDFVFAHAVSARLAQSSLFQKHFEQRAKLPLGERSGRGYVLFVKK